MKEDNVYVTFTYNNTSGGFEDMIFDDVTKRIAILENPSEYEVGVTNLFMKTPTAGTQFPASGSFSSIMVMSNSIGVRQQFTNQVENDLEPVIAVLQYGPSGTTLPSYTVGYVQYPDIFNTGDVKYRDIQNSSPLYRLNISIKAKMRDGSYEFFSGNGSSHASVTLHFRKKR